MAISRVVARGASFRSRILTACALVAAVSTAAGLPAARAAESTGSEADLRQLEAQLAPAQRDEMKQDSSSAGASVATDLQENRLKQVARKVLDQLVAEGVDTLREQGELALADQFEREWHAYNYLAADQLGALDLGDHPPLSQWLANFYDSLYKKTRGVVRAIRILKDLNTINYALPVVLHPRGTWRANSAGDWIEYRKHFIPFANIATYWITYESCKVVVKKYVPLIASRLCGYGAGKLEWYMGRHLAPRISDMIYKRANRLADIAGYDGEELPSLGGSDLVREFRQQWDSPADGEIEFAPN